MGYRAREAKRRARYKGQLQIHAARRNRNAQTADKYFLTFAQHDCRCAACGGHLRRGAEMVYRKNGSVKLCVACAERDPLVAYRPSAKWEARQKIKVKRGAAWMRERK